MIYVKEKNEKDILYILDNLRTEDLHEVEMLRGKNFKSEIVKEIMNSDGYFVLGINREDRLPVAMGGVCDLKNGVGCVWLLGTAEISKHKVSVFRNLKKDILNFDEDYWLTYNMLYKENYLAKNWLKCCGYRFAQSEKEKNIYDKALMRQYKIPEGFELFYRRREVRGLKDT